MNGHFALLDTESSEVEFCFLAIVGGAIAFIFKPLGFGTWRAVAATLSGFVAKEGIVSTMGVIAGFDGEAESFSSSMRTAFNSFLSASGTGTEGKTLLALAAFSFLVFNLFDSPCLAAISTMAKEMGSKKYFWFAIIFQNVMAYCIALMVYQIGGLILGVLSFGVGTVAAFAILAVILFLLFRPDPNKKVRKSN
jgi:ferrous iron transport protein B